MQEKNKQELVLMKVFDNEPFEGYVDTSLEETEEDEERVCFKESCIMCKRKLWYSFL